MSVVEDACSVAIRAHYARGGESAAVALKFGAAQNHERSYWVKCTNEQGDSKLPSTTKGIGRSAIRT